MATKSIDIKSKAGKTVGSHSLSEAITAANPSMTTVHRAVVAEEANKRQGTQSSKTRADVRGGGRKPYKQKKTGNARQGTVSAPHYTHGGVAFAPKPRSYTKAVNKKERRQAILGALNEKVVKGDLVIADTIVFAEPKTRDAAALLAALGLDNVRRVLVILPGYDLATLKSFHNIPQVTVRTAPSTEEGAKTQAFSARDVIVAHKVLIAQDALAKIEEVWG